MMHIDIIHFCAIMKKERATEFCSPSFCIFFLGNFLVYRRMRPHSIKMFPDFNAFFQMVYLAFSMGILPTS